MVDTRTAARETLKANPVEPSGGFLNGATKFLDGLVQDTYEVGVKATLDAKVIKNPELKGIVNVISADESMVGAIANLKRTNPNMLDKIMKGFGGGDATTPETLKITEAALSNDVLRGQLTQVINNVADNPNITDQNVSALMEATESYKTTIEGFGMTGIFGVATGMLSAEKQAQLDVATKDLTQAYIDVGMTSEDAKAGINQAWVLGANQKIDGMDDIGSHMNGFINSAMYDSGKFFEVLGMGGLAETLGMADKGLADILVSFGMDEATINSFISTITNFLNEHLNFDLIDGLDGANMTALPEFVEKNIGKSVDRIAPKTTNGMTAEEAKTTAENNGKPLTGNEPKVITGDNDNKVVGNSFNKHASEGNNNLPTTGPAQALQEHAANMAQIQEMRAQTGFSLN